MPREDRVIAATLGLSGFAVAIIAGVTAGNEPTLVMFRALVAMIACYVLGVAVGGVFKHVLDAHIVEHTRTHPIPDVNAANGVPPAQPSGTEKKK